MRNRKVYIIIPRLINTGPVKGAVALANNLHQYLPVSLVCLKGVPCSPLELNLNPKIPIVDISQRNWINKITYLSKTLTDESTRNKITTISYCFSADFVNCFIRGSTKKISSIRGNLATNYQVNFGFVGLALAKLHYFLVRNFDHVIALSKSMKQELLKNDIKTPELIPNFIDEKYIDSQKIFPENNSTPQIVYLGRVAKGKNLDLLLQTLVSLKNENLSYHLHVVGAGEYSQKLIEFCEKNSLMSYVTFHGYQKNPYKLLQNGDLVVLPSESEGVPRAILESLYLGIPCMLKNVDAAGELISQGENGFLFDSCSELENILKEFILNYRPKDKNTRSTLLPKTFSMKPAIEKHLELIRRE